MEKLDLILAYWTFFAAWGAFYVIVKALKAGPLSSQRAKEVRWVRAVRRWCPLPLHPIIWGVLVGSIPSMPLPNGVDPGLGAVLYYAGAGVAAVVWRDIWREWQKHRSGG